MKTRAILVALALGTLLAACSSVSTPGDIHTSPTSVVRAFIQGYMEGDRDLILDSMAPAVRQRISDELSVDALQKSKTAIQEVWGISGAAFDASRIRLKVEADRGDKQFVDAMYDGKACGDQATVVKIDGKWYIEWF